MWHHLLTKVTVQRELLQLSLSIETNSLSTNQFSVSIKVRMTNWTSLTTLLVGKIEVNLFLRSESILTSIQACLNLLEKEKNLSKTLENFTKEWTRERLHNINQVINSIIPRPALLFTFSKILITVNRLITSMSINQQWSLRKLMKLLWNHTL